MAETDLPAAKLSDTARAVAFSDGVFAIVITLLVLELRVPEAPPGQLLSGLLSEWPAYVAYVASYLYVAVVWLNHKHAFGHIRLMDRGLHWANLWILFSTALLPFSTAVVSEALRRGNLTDERVAIAFYALIGAFMCLSWLAFFEYLRHHPQLTHDKSEPVFFRQESTRAGAGVAAYIIAGVLGFQATPTVALMIFLALPIFYGVTDHGLYELTVVVRRRRRRG